MMKRGKARAAGRTAQSARWRCRGRFGATAGCIVVLLLWFVPPATAQQRLADSRLKNGSAVRQVFRPLVAQARRATVRIEAEGELLVLGTVVDPDGYVLTKASELGDSVYCRLRNGRLLPAQLVGVNREHDVALLKVAATRLTAVRWSSNENDPAVGSLLATVGLDDDPIAVGIVSVARRAIPRERGVLGIVIADEEEGPRITRVFPHSGAADAGLEAGDLVLRAGGQAVDSAATLTEIIGRLRPGDTLKLLIRRGEEEEKEIVATLGSAMTTFLTRNNLQNQLGGRISKRRDGFPAVLQHDSVLRPEDCGSVVVDLTGRAVGLNIARGGRVETYAIPASVLLPLIEELKSYRPAPSSETSAPAQVAGERPR